MEASWSNYNSKTYCKMYFGILMLHSGITLKDQQKRASELQENLVSETLSGITSLALKTIIKTISKKLQFKA